MDSKAELVDRLELIERMLLEGRRTLERWSWVYVMWGAGHLLGVLASLTLTPEKAGLVWAGLMTTCGGVMGIFGARMSKGQQVETQHGRALSAVWWTFVLMLGFVAVRAAAGATLSSSYAVFAAVYGGAFFASGFIVRWLPLRMNGLLWWGAGAAMNFLGNRQTLLLLAGMALVGEVGFGLYAMAHERKVMAGER